MSSRCLAFHYSFALSLFTVRPFDFCRRYQSCDVLNLQPGTCSVVQTYSFSQSNIALDGVAGCFIVTVSVPFGESLATTGSLFALLNVSAQASNVTQVAEVAQLPPTV